MMQTLIIIVFHDDNHSLSKLEGNFDFSSIINFSFSKFGKMLFVDEQKIVLMLKPQFQ